MLAHELPVADHGTIQVVDRAVDEILRRDLAEPAPRERLDERRLVGRQLVRDLFQNRVELRGVDVRLK